MSLESKVKSLEQIVKNSGCHDDTCLKEIVLDLAKLRDAAQEDDKTIKMLREEVESLKKSVSALEKTVTKKDNRIGFLLQYVEELEARK